MNKVSYCDIVLEKYNPIVLIYLLTDLSSSDENRHKEKESFANSAPVLWRIGTSSLLDM